MSARMLSSLTEENQDLQKQIGCMNGLFQLFDRHHFLTGRRLHGQNHKRLLTGATDGMELKSAMQSPMEKSPRETVKNNVSSSSDSSKGPSILQQSKRVQQEPTSCNQNNFKESPSKIQPYRQQNFASHSGRQSPDFRDVVKDSMHREARSLSVKTVTKVEGKVHVMKHIDSPRPFQQSNNVKPSDGARQVTAKFGDTAWNPRDDKVGLLKHTPKDHPRFSYDERESREAARSSVRLKDFPRLSLDSREQSFRSSASESRSNFLLDDARRDNDNSICSPHTNSEMYCHTRSSSVVAKLMGLEVLPNAIPSNEIETVTLKSFPTNVSAPISTKSTEKSKKNQVKWSPPISEKDFSSPRMKSTKSIMRASSTSRFPLEPAPWRQQEVSKTSHKSTVRNTDMELSIKTPKIPSSVYGEMEKRISELEFRKSGKDLRALKQILEAMQKTRARLEVQTEENVNSDVNLEMVQKRQQCNPLSPTIKGTRPPKRDNAVENKTWKDTTSRMKDVGDSGWLLPSPDKKTKGGTSKAMQKPTLRQQNEGSYLALGRSSGTVSPRLQQQKKQSCPSTTSPEFIRVRRQSMKQSKDSGSSKRRLQANPSTLMPVDEESSEISSSTRNFSEQGDAASMQSESNNSSGSHADGEVTSRNLSFKVNAKRLEDAKDKSDMTRLNENTTLGELAIVTIEQPSPVSVLDTSFYEEDSPSPVKKKTTAFHDGELWYLDYEDCSSYSTGIDLGTKTSHKKLEHINDLVHQIRLLDLNHEANMDHLESLSQNHNPDHRYITKILLASGLLNNVDSISTAILHSSNHLIDQKLFYILEQTEDSKKSARVNFTKKIHRHNVFDAVNEILVQKLASESCLMQGQHRLSGQKLLKELKSNIDHLNPKKASVTIDSEDDELISILNADMTSQSENWTNCRSEIPSLVLDVERLIYKDLITEIISDEARVQQIRRRRHCRQLFTV